MLDSRELDDLLAHLGRGGIGVDVRQRADLLLLLGAEVNRFPSPGRLAAAGSRIGPVVCRSASEQRRFQALYRTWRLRVEAEHDTAKDHRSPGRAGDPGGEGAGPKGKDGTPGLLGSADRAERKLRAPSRSLGWVAALALLATVTVVAFHAGGRDVAPALAPALRAGPGDLVAAPGARTARGAAIRRSTGTGILRLLALVAPLALFALWLTWRVRARRYTRAVIGDRSLTGLRGLGSKGNAVAALFPGSATRGIASFKRWQRPVRNGIDLVRSIQLTAERGGFPVLAPRWTRERRRYIAVIELRAAEDHGARIARLLAAALEEQEIDCRVFLCHGSPEHVFPERSGAQLAPPIALDALVRANPDSAFLLFVDPESCRHPLTGSGHRWLARLAESAPCALLPMPGADEALLADIERSGCPIAPRTVSGLADVPRLWMGAKARARARARHPGTGTASKGHEPSRAPPVTGDDRLYPAARLDALGWRWLRACAVLPRLSFDLTVHLGAALRAPSGEGALQERRLLELSSLPWFRDGALPDPVRRTLLAAMRPDEDREVRRLLYRALGQELGDPEAIPPAGAERERRLRDLVRTYVRTRGSADPLVDPTASRFLLFPRWGRTLFAWPERLRRLLGFPVDAVPGVYFLLALAGVWLLGGLVDLLEANAPAFNAWFAGHRMWVGLGIYLATVGSWSAFWTAVALDPRFNLVTPELWRRRVRVEELPPITKLPYYP